MARLGPSVRIRYTMVTFIETELIIPFEPLYYFYFFCCMSSFIKSDNLSLLEFVIG